MRSNLADLPSLDAFVSLPLVQIGMQKHDVTLDLKYATSDNICHQPIYKNAICYLRSEAEVCLRRAVALARAIGLRLHIFDAYRPAVAQQCLWQACPNADYIIPPSIGSQHTRAIAIDLTLSTRDGHVLDMGTGFDAMVDQSHHGRTDISIEAQQNRYLLLGLMRVAGWESIPTEWWHFQLPGDWPLVDESELEQLLM